MKPIGQYNLGRLQRLRSAASPESTCDRGAVLLGHRGDVLEQRDLPDGQFAPQSLELTDTGLPGAAFLIETDGSHFMGFRVSRL